MSTNKVEDLLGSFASSVSMPPPGGDPSRCSAADNKTSSSERVNNKPRLQHLRLDIPQLPEPPVPMSTTSSTSSSTSWRALHAKPPNYPQRTYSRTNSSSSTSFSSSGIGGTLYNTFPQSSTTMLANQSAASNGSVFASSFHASIGLTMEKARQRLLCAIEMKIEEKEKSANFTKEFRDPFSLLLLLCALFRFTDYSRHLHRARIYAADGTSGDPGIVGNGLARGVVSSINYPLLEGSFLLAAAILNVILNALQKKRHHKEIADRVRFAVREMQKREPPESIPAAATTPLSSTSKSIQDDEIARNLFRMKNTVLLPSTCHAACYRDGQWQRIPMNLLVEGDVIALMNGDIAPGDVRLIEELYMTNERKSEHRLSHSRSQSGASSGEEDCGSISRRGTETEELEAMSQATERVFERGSKIPPATTNQMRETPRCTVTFQPLTLLSLCGEMRLFQMLETPVLHDIKDAFFKINRPETFSQKLLAKARLVAGSICSMYSVFVLLAICLRVIVQHRSLDITLDHILLAPIGIWLCFASLNTPFVLFLAEVMATSSMLAHFERIVITKPTKKSKKNKSSALDPQYGAAQAVSPPHGPPLQKSKRSTRRLSRSGSDALSHAGLVDSSSAAADVPNDPARGAATTTPTPNHEGIYDVEEREKLRLAKISSSHAPFWRSLHYFFITLRFRLFDCARAHLNTTDRLAVPFRSFRLLERLGSTTMLCCFDDDILCEESPCAEEIFLFNNKSSAAGGLVSNSTTVLDLHHDRDCETGLKFEDPKWKKHLPSLKPIGLAILLNHAADRKAQYEKSLKYLTNEINSTPNELASFCGAASVATKDPLWRNCLLKLSAHVRMLPFPKHLLNLSREIGFVEEDLECFERRQSIHVICPRLAYLDHTIDHHDQGQEDTRYRGNLKTHLYSTVVLDKRSNSHQILSRGHPALALTQCSEYWDGQSICPMTSEKRRAILDMYNQWRVEDLDCVALTYAPIPHKFSSLFTSDGHRRSGSITKNVPPNSAANGQSQTALPPVYLVEDSLAGELNPEENKSRGGSKSRQLSPAGSISSFDESRRNDAEMTMRTLSPSSRPRGALYGASSDVTSSVGGMLPSEVESSEKDALLWKLREDQIFLGMVATGVQPKRGIPDFIEDLTASGIRFVYFSPRNMRRSKLLAESMGIETDWNCAISLRPLESDTPDPHRMTSNYSDWDVKARLPHGVEAIRRHLEEVDNVPLLVSLYTDSTPETIGEMISVFQENHEVVLGVGSSLKESNAQLFAKSDLAIALQTDLRTFFEEPLPTGKDLPVFTADDLSLSHLLNTLACSFRIQTDDHRHHQATGATNANGTKDSETDKLKNPASPDKAGSSKHHNVCGNLNHLIELIRLGRKALTNMHQMLVFIFVSQLFLATLILGAYVLPFPVVPQLNCGSIFWLLWVFVPVLSLSMLATPSDKEVMKRTPSKNEPIEVREDLPRLAWYFVLRHVPSVFVCLCVYECLFGFSLESGTSIAARGSSVSPLGDDPMVHYQHFRWVDFIFHQDIGLMHPRPFVVKVAANRAEAGMLLMIAVSMVASSCGYLYRTESVLTNSPFRNRWWVASAVLLVVVHCLVCGFIAGFDAVTLQNASGVVVMSSSSLGQFLTQEVPVTFWLICLVWPVVILGIDEAVKNHDRKYLTRYYKFLRMQFDTRLGMWSPK